MHVTRQLIVAQRKPTTSSLGQKYPNCQKMGCFVFVGEIFWATCVRDQVMELTFSFRCLCSFCAFNLFLFLHNLTLILTGLWFLKGWFKALLVLVFTENQCGLNSKKLIIQIFGLFQGQLTCRKQLSGHSHTIFTDTKVVGSISTII